jgi:hypothetical protein
MFAGVALTLAIVLKGISLNGNSWRVEMARWEINYFSVVNFSSTFF